MSELKVTGIGTNVENASKNDVKIKEEKNLSVWDSEKKSENELLEVEVDIDDITSALSENKKTIKTSLKNFSEKLILKTGTITAKTGMPVAGKLLNLSLIPDSKREKYANKYEGEILSPELSAEILKEFGLEEGKTGHTTSEQMQLETIIFNNNSKIAKSVNKNKVLQALIKQWADNGAEPNSIIDFNTANSGSFDLRMGLGFSLIVGLHMTDDGYAEGYIEDVYDYDKFYAKGKDEESNFLRRVKSKGVQTLNNMAVDLQEVGKLDNYRVLIPIKVKVS